MPHAIRFHKTAGPEVLQWEDVEVGKPGPSEARVRHSVKIEINQTYPLSEAAQAHRDLQSRKTTGSTIFIV